MKYVIKRILGINALEESIKELRKFLMNYWSHTRNLYDLNDVNAKKIQELEQKLDDRTKQILLLLEQLLDRLEKHVTPEETEVAEEVRVIKKSSVSDKEKIILQILHQNAAFSSDNSLSTRFIYHNLPFSITQRGLRKKLYLLESLGLISRVRDGKENKWYIRTGKISEVKEKIAEPIKKKRNRN